MTENARALRASLAWARPGFQLELELDVPSAGVTAFFGRSGSGKTTCLRLLAGLERGRGSLHAFGECWQDDARRVYVPTERRRIGYVFQEPSLFPHLTVQGNLDYATKRRRAGAAALGLDSAVDLLGIAPLLSRSPEHLSGGERQRVAIARALHGAPRLLLLDEPLAAVDESRKAEVLPYLERLRDELSIPIVYVSHALDEVARLSDRLVLLDQGRILAVGATAEVMSRLDLPLSGSDQGGSILAARVAEHDEPYALSRVEFSGGALWVSRIARPIGANVRARVLARDVSIALTEPGASSILNVLPAEVVELSDAGPDRVNVRLAIGPDRTPLLSRVTRRSREALGLRPGLRVYAQVKSVALLM